MFLFQQFKCPIENTDLNTGDLKAKCADDFSERKLIKETNRSAQLIGITSLSRHERNRGKELRSFPFLIDLVWKRR